MKETAMSRVLNQQEIQQLATQIAPAVSQQLGGGSGNRKNTRAIKKLGNDLRVRVPAVVGRETVQELKQITTVQEGDIGVVQATGNLWIVDSVSSGGSTWVPAGGVYHAADYGVLADDSTDNSVALQEWIDDTLAVFGHGVLPNGKVRFGTQLSIFDPCIIEGAGSASGRWNASVAGTQMIWTGSATEHCVVIGGTALSQSDNRICEGVRLRHLLFYPLVPGDGYGIMVDGSQIFDPLRLPARDIHFFDIATRWFNGGIDKHGNVFDCSFHHVHTEPHSTTTRCAFNDIEAVSFGVDKPKNNSYFRCLWDSPSSSVLAAYIRNSTAVDCKWQGISGVGISEDTQLISCEAESEGSATAGSVGVLVDGQNCRVLMKLIGGYDVGLQIGDGVNTVRGDVHHCEVDVIAGCNTGVWVTDGGARDGEIYIGFFQNVVTELTDDRGLGECKYGRPLHRDTDGTGDFGLGPGQGIALNNAIGAARCALRWNGTTRSIVSRTSVGAERTRMTVADGQDTEEWVIGLHAGSDPGFVRLQLNGQQYSKRINHLPSGTTETLDWNNSNVHKIDLESATGDVTLTLSNPQDGAVYKVIVQQSGTTPRNLIWPASVRWPGGTPPTISTGADDVDVITLVYDDALSAYLGTFAQGFA